jgi:DNA topoisomerase II
MESDSDDYMQDAMSDSEDDFMASEDDKPVKAVAPKKKGAVLAPKESALNSVPPKSTVQKSKTKSVEEIYQKKTQLEHILLRPDTYSKC